MEGPRLQGRGPDRAQPRAEGALRPPPAPPRDRARRARPSCSSAKVLLLGAGGLGSPTALYLAAAGVGTLGIVDDDEVDLSNLQRQVIHTTDGIGTPKVDSAAEAIARAQPGREGRQVPRRASTPRNIMEIIDGYDVIVDGVDNFPTRYLLNDATVRLDIPVVSRVDPRLRRPALGLQAARRPVLPLPLPGPAAGRAGAVLRRQRRPRRAAGHDGPAAGDRGRQARDRRRRAAGRPAAALRGARRDVHRAQGPARPGVPDLLAATRPRSPTTRWACSRTTRRSAPPPASG